MRRYTSTRLLFAVFLVASAACGKLPGQHSKDRDKDDDDGAEEDDVLPPDVVAWDAAACQFSLKQIPFDDTSPTIEGVKEGENVRCGYVSVPETRAKPDGRRIKIHFAEFYPDGGSAASAPLVVHFGGPGETGQGPASLGHSLAVGTGRNVLAIGQRGSYFSNGFTWDADLCDAKNEDQKPCNADFSARYDLASYNTKESVADFMDVASALGHDKVVAYGISYGTFFMSRLAHDFPDRVEALIIDSVMPYDGKEYLDGTDMDVTYHEYHHSLRETYAKYCDGDQADPDLAVGLCPRVDPKATTGAMVWASADEASHALRDFMANPDTPTEKLQFIDGELYNLTMYQLYTGLTLFETAGVVKDDYDTRYKTVDVYLKKLLGDEASLTNLLGKPTEADARFFSVDLLGVVTCNETARLVNLKKMAATLAADEEIGAIPKSAIVGRYACPTDFQWLDTPASDVFGEVPPAIKTLVVNATHDAATPISGARRVAKQIGANAKLIEVPCTGHGVLGQTGKEAETLKSFLAGDLGDPATVATSLCDESTASLSLTGDASARRRTIRPAARGWNHR